MDKVFSPRKLQAILDAQGHDAKWLAGETGATPTTVAQWLAGVSRPRGSSLNLICRVLDVSEDELLAAPRRRQTT